MGVESRFTADERVGDYRICELLGEGAMGEVYLAQDMVLGRRVALKVLKREVMANDGVTRFLEEARVTASFNHPHIVTLHAFGEHAGRPYLALEYVEGESLRRRISAAPIPVAEALRFARAIAAALADAHQRGLVHADLKPENVVIANDGRVRVVDFGLSKLTGAAGGSASGTPAYMAPERWRGSPPTGAIDVWSLGVMLCEAVQGSRPFTNEQLAKLAFATSIPLALPDAPWAALAATCLAHEPADRPDAASLVQRLDALIDARPASDPLRNPFPGLASFDREDARLYFGRAAEIDALVEQLRTRPLTPLTGPSGVGKSSVVRAGLLPRLEQSGRWIAIELRPGESPFESLSAALARAGDNESAASLREHPARLSLALGRIAAHHDAQVLLFIDQFEEAFTLGTESTELCASLAAAAIVDERWRIVLTVRDDFLGRLATTAIRSHLGAVLSLGPMTAADLRSTITGPLAVTDHDVDRPELIDRIVGDVRDQPACLPLLQFACGALWERRDVANRKLLTSTYEEIGGASGALASHADRCLAQLTPERVRDARGILLLLVGPDGTRRPKPRAHLVEGMSDDAIETLDKLVEWRLLASSRTAEHEDPVVELAHEALATTWPRLVRWLDETVEERVLSAEIEAAAELWKRRGQRGDETWRGPPLSEALRKVDEWNVSLSSASRAFLDAGLAGDAQRRRRRRWLTAAIIGSLAVAAVGAAVTALVLAEQKRDAEERQVTERLIAADRGVFQLEIEPFDWDPVEQKASAPTTLPTLSWRLRAADQGEPGRPYEGDEIARSTPRWDGSTLVETVESRSGAAMLEIVREGCGPSLIVLQRLPNYNERHVPSIVHVRVPTCAASHADVIQIPAGPFMANEVLNAKESEDRQAQLAAFGIDRTEVTRGAFALYDAMEKLTGDTVLPSRHLAAAGLAKARHPVVGMTVQTARNYCRFMGKRLPTIEQWQKSVRGGLMVDGVLNPAPTRLNPWVVATTKRPANLDHTQDDFGLAEVAAFPEDRSPYGVMDLAGNVGEWTRSRSTLAEYPGLSVVAGGSWDMPSATGFHKVNWRNHRADRYVDFSVGVRCATD